MGRERGEDGKDGYHRECRKSFCHITLHIQVEVSLGVYVTMHTTQMSTTRSHRLSAIQ